MNLSDVKQWLGLWLHGRKERNAPGQGVDALLLEERPLTPGAVVRRMQIEWTLNVLPWLASGAFVVTAGYALAQLWVRPSQVQAVWPLYVVQSVVPLLLLVVARTSLRNHVEKLLLAADLMYSAALAAQLLGADSRPSAIAGFMGVKFLAIAVFVPWEARYQWMSIVPSWLVFATLLPHSPGLRNETHILPLYALPLFAGVFSVLGVHSAARRRRQLIDESVARELALSRLRLLVEYMPAGCILCDREFRYVYWNRAAEGIFGYRLEEVRGKSAFEVITPPHLRDFSRRGMDLVIRMGALGPLRAENLTKDGRKIICEWSSVALRDADGSLLGLLSMCQDITERHRDDEARREALEKLREMDRARRDFVATMSHELRNPINALLGYAALLAEGALGPLNEKQRETVERMLQRGRDLLELVHSTLDISRLEKGEGLVRLQLLEPAVLLEQVRRETLETPPKATVRIAWEIDPELPALYTDQAKLKVIIKNLVSNAIKYTDRGEVRVRARRHYPGVEIIVSDTGRGIPKEHLEKIFEPFHQVRHGDQDEPAGAGLGLYIVHRFAELLGAEIDVESEVGRGSTFVVRVPTQPPGTLLG